MSISDLTELTESLPRTLRDNVLGYARSVERALDGIFREERIRFDEQLGDALVFVAGVKKLYEVVSSTYWLADNSLGSTDQQAAPTEMAVVGSLRLRRGTGFHQSLAKLLRDLENLLAELELTEIITERSYGRILRWLADRY